MFSSNIRNLNSFQVAAGLNFTVFLARQGHVYTCGTNTHGQLGHGDTQDRPTPKMVGSLEGVGTVVQIAAGPSYVLAVTDNGSVYSFGSGANFCLGHGEQQNELQPRPIQTFKRKGIHILRVSAGDEHVVALDSSGYVYTWGKGYCGALGHGDEIDKTLPEPLISLKSQLAVQVCARKRKTFVLVDGGSVYGFGWMGFWSLGFPDRGASDKVMKPRILDSLRGHRVSQISTGNGRGNNSSFRMQMKCKRLSSAFVKCNTAHWIDHTSGSIGHTSAIQDQQLLVEIGEMELLTNEYASKKKELLSLLLWLQLQYDLTDRISELPDELLVCVLSRLTLKEAARSSILSPRWKDLWQWGTLNFDPTNLNLDRNDYIQWVDRVLFSHQASSFDELRVCFDLDKRFTVKINRWLEVALSKRVRRLELDFTPTDLSHRNRMMNYTLPPELLLIHASSKYSLTRLCLKYVKVKGQILEYLLSSCVLLETLHVSHSELLPKSSEQLIDLKVCGSSSLRLKHLHISFCDYIESMEVSAPNLVSFGYCGRRKIQLHFKYVPQLRDVTYRHYDGFRPSDFLYSNLILNQLVNLSLNFINSIDQKLLLQCPQLPNLRHLTCDVLVLGRSSSMHLLHLTSLIHASPNLRKFKLNIEMTKDAHIELEAREVGEVIEFVGRNRYYHPNENLREVEIVGFVGAKSDMELLTYLLKTASLLDKVVINTNHSEAIDFVRKLLSQIQFPDLEFDCRRVIFSTHQLGVQLIWNQEAPCWDWMEVARARSNKPQIVIIT
ncbi:Regulator of chromosome condensation, RCC1 [Corchorus olitorius]|uniref:Regulator of chromosome condensation, RCC1 n=1 Tax=Corchorus olitorius TaxID=93759 RepID=A0A1R3KCA5_9ROSI|nr:Regulator of chromosome condensation, RCC1 [Corchorus olitorius]